MYQNRCCHMNDRMLLNFVVVINCNLLNSFSVMLVYSSELHLKPMMNLNKDWRIVLNSCYSMNDTSVFGNLPMFEQVRMDMLLCTYRNETIRYIYIYKICIRSSFFFFFFFFSPFLFFYSFYLWLGYAYEKKAADEKKNEALYCRCRTKYI